MSLCPRAAAQALQSPPEMDQLEYKQGAAYFNQNDYPQYTLQPSNRFGPDQEPLLALPSIDSQQNQLAPSAASDSCMSRYLRWLIKASLSRSDSAASPSPSRTAWLHVLLIANFLITVVAFIAACVHFNSFSSLFLYLAFLIVTFPILSLTLFLVRSRSDHYKLHLPEFSPNSTPLSEQSSLSFASFFARPPSPPTFAAGSSTRRRSRSCRPARVETVARYAQYLFVVLWFLAIVEWVCFRPILPSDMVTSGEGMAAFLRSPPSTGSTSSQPLKVFIASNLYNSQEVLPSYTSSLKALIGQLGPDNVFVSVYESHSKDRTKEMLAQLDTDLAQLNVPRRILSDDRAVRMNKSSPVQDRIQFLAEVRNVAMQPLLDPSSANTTFTHVLWINDITFTSQDALELLHTNNARYDQVCASDFIGNGFYDTWVTRDSEGNTLKRVWPYFKRWQDVEAMREGRPFEVNSCWNGMTAFDAKWFRPAASGSSLSSANPEDDPVLLPLKFRTSSDCTSSECQLVSYDIHRALYPTRPAILINPKVKVAYTEREYYLFNTLIPSPILRPWRIVWRDWIGYKLFGWVTEFRRWNDECAAKQKWWSKEPTTI